MELYKRYEHLPMLIHFRYSTHGKPSVLNCHPFPVWDNKYALIHNGTINIAQSISKDLNDTGHFAKLIMEPMLKIGVNPEKAAFRWLIQESIGHSKVLIMDQQGKIIIYNESVGEYEDAIDKAGNPVTFDGPDGPEVASVWYSNAGYKFTKRRGKQRPEGDNYSGYFDCGSGCEEVTPAEVPHGVDVGFVGRARLDLPPEPAGIIAGFKSGVRTTADPGPVSVPIKNASASAMAIMAANGATVRTEKDGTVTQVDDDSMITGPLFGCRVELEIAHLKESMNLSREEAIKCLGLEHKDAISFVA